MFTQSEQETSSTYRELLAIQLAIQAFEPLLTGSKVKLFTDSQVAMKIAQVGSMKLEYHKLAISIFSMCFRANIQLDLQWIDQLRNLVTAPSHNMKTRLIMQKQ
jgi:ribonuclease HI